MHKFRRAGDMDNNPPMTAFVMTQDTNLHLIRSFAFEIDILLSLDFNMGHDRIYLAVPGSGIVDDFAIEHVFGP